MYKYVGTSRTHQPLLGPIMVKRESLGTLRWLDVRFSQLVLQGSHDSGMFTSLHPGWAAASLVSAGMRGRVGAASIIIYLLIVLNKPHVQFRFVKMITKMKLDSDMSVFPPHTIFSLVYQYQSWSVHFFRGNFLIDHGISFVHVLTKLLKTFNIDLELAICNIANTQKDIIYDQLRHGAR
jgi:hypothetical protein